MHSANTGVDISVIVLNYNGAVWLEHCLQSLQSQTILPEIEVIVADNLSTDGSEGLASRIMAQWPNGMFLQHSENLGYCEGNNRAAVLAKGKYLLFLNNDTWLEPNCLENLRREVQLARAQAACPLVLNYNDETFQSLGAFGFDIFGLPSSREFDRQKREVLMPEGCAYLIQRNLFNQLGGFDPEFFMFADELDLSWRVWISGHLALAIPSARMHHRGAAQVNPEGEKQIVKFRTSETKRFFANRNSLLVLLKNAQHILLFLVPLQLALLFLEMIASFVLVRRLSFLKRGYWDAVIDCWRLRNLIFEQRRRIRGLRKRSDWWMLRFFRLHLNRLDEIKRVRRYGIPKVSPT
jgi:GT2 family glycosyltransferase